ncbi:F-box protein At5g07610-like [Papaver somniferum]|nr:F-box protein At5g07610-like [Papaver somniferum]
MTVYLSIDILEEILLRLPVKSLIVFKCVSKQWLSLISNPSFARRHSLQKLGRSVTGLFVQDPSWLGLYGNAFVFLDESKRNNVISKSFNPYAKSLPCPIDFRRRTIQSCNGLLCCKTSHNNPTFYVYNPSTNHHKILPRSPFKKDGFKSFCSVSLAFDPDKSPHYEVISIWAHKCRTLGVEIYSSKSESWKDLGMVNGSGRIYIVEDTGVFLNGSLHWFNRYGSCYLDVGEKSLQLKKMPAPPVAREDQVYGQTTWIVYFGECNGHIHLMKAYRKFPTSLYIMELEMDYTKWKVKYHINIELLTSAYYSEMVFDMHYQSIQDFSVLFVEDHDDDESKTSKMVIQIREHIIFYDLKDMTFNEVKDIQLTRRHPYKRLATPFIESLACV